MSTTNVFSTPDNLTGNLNGLFKETYADKLKELIPENLYITSKIKFMEKNKQPGNLFHQPIVLGMEHGITFASSDEDGFSLQPAVSGVIKDAQVRGNPMVMRSLIGYAAVSRATQGGAQAFMDATKFVVGNMLKSFAKKLEIQMFYGQKGYGAISAISTNVLTIKTAEWASGVWAGAEGMPIEIRSYEAAGATPSSSTSRGNFKVTSVDFDARTVTLDAAPTGVVVTPTQEDVIFHMGAFGNEFPGIHKILETTTGTLFNINVGTYNLYRGNQYSAASAALSFTKMNLAAAKAVEKGQSGKLVALVSTKAWANILNAQDALRKYDASYNKTEQVQGSQSIKFYSQNGEIEIVPSIYVKEGYSYLLSFDCWARVGSQDVSFKRPGRGDDFFRDVDNAAAFELRLYTDQAIFCSALGHNVLITAVVNAT